MKFLKRPSTPSILGNLRLRANKCKGRAQDEIWTPLRKMQGKTCTYCQIR